MVTSEPIERTDQMAVEDMSLAGDGEDELLLAVALTATLEAYQRRVSRGRFSSAESDGTGSGSRTWQLIARWEGLHGQR